MAVLRGIRQPSVNSYQELCNLKPEDGWIVHVVEENSDYYYDGEKQSWVSFECDDHMMTTDADKKVVSNRIMFETVDLNTIILYIVLTICIMFSIFFSLQDLALTLAGVLAGRASNNIRK